MGKTRYTIFYIIIFLCLQIFSCLYFVYFFFDLFLCILILYFLITFQKKGTIDYSKVLFSYPTRNNVQVLKGLDLTVHNGQTVALVGPSGCGKSTIVQLIERFYDPDGGEISVDSEDLRDMSLAHLRSNLGIVSQEPNLFDRTIGENIAYGDNSREVPQEDIIEAARKANIHNFISSLPLVSTHCLFKIQNYLFLSFRDTIQDWEKKERNSQVDRNNVLLLQGLW